MDKRVFLATWKDIPSQNEVQSEIKDVQHNAGKYSVCAVSHPNLGVLVVTTLKNQKCNMADACEQIYPEENIKYL